LEKISFSDVIGIGGIAFATVLLVLDKAGKLRGGWLFGLLCLAGAMTLFIALGNSWVMDSPHKWKLWRGAFMVCFFAFAYSGLAIMISGGSEKSAPDASTRPSAVNPNPETKEKISEKGFEVANLPPSTGEGYLDQDGRREYLSNVYIQVAVLNHGTPSIIKDWKGLLRLQDGTLVEGVVMKVGTMNVAVNGPNGPVRMPTSPMLLEPWSRKPIPTGERVVGCLIFKFPPGMSKKIAGPGGAFILKLWDDQGRETTLDLPWEEHKVTDILSLPGMDPI